MPDFLPQLAAESLSADAAIGFRYQSHVDVSDVHVARTSTKRRKSESDFLMRACHSSRFFSLDPRVSEIRPRRGLDSDVDLRLILGSEEARANQSHGRKSERDNEGGQRKQNHRHPVIERPGNQPLVALCHPVEPVVELLERAGDRIAMLARLHLRVGPVRRQHGVE